MFNQCSSVAEILLQTIFLFSVWNRRSNNTDAIGVYRAYLKAAIGALVIGAILWLVHGALRMTLDGRTLITDLAVISIVSMLFVVLTGLWGWIFNIEAIQYMFGRVASLNVLKKSSRG